MTIKEFWCDVCDEVLVRDDKPETGTFFVKHGHVLNRATGEAGDWVEICWAVCSTCVAKVPDKLEV